MPRWNVRPCPDRTLELATHTRSCPTCGQPLWAANKPRRTVITRDGLILLRLQVRSCRNPDCPRHRICLRPEQEGRFALPQHEFGLDVIALVGTLRHAEHRSLPEIHAELVRRGIGSAIMPDSEARQVSELRRVELATPVHWRVYLASRPLAEVGRATARLSEILMSAPGTLHHNGNGNHNSDAQHNGDVAVTRQSSRAPRSGSRRPGVPAPG